MTVLPLDVNVQGVGGDEALVHSCAADLDWQPCAHFGPDQRHLGTQAKLPTCLLDAILGA